MLPVDGSRRRKAGRVSGLGGAAAAGRNYYELDPQAADRLRRWASAGRSQAWWREYTGALPAGADTYVDYESGASTIRSFAAAIVPPLLQTEAYAGELYKVLPAIKSEESARRVLEVRARRQQLLAESDEAPQLSFVLDEAVLRRPFGSPDDFREQLDHLHVVSRQRNVSRAHRRDPGRDSSRRVRSGVSARR